MPHEAHFCVHIPVQSERDVLLPTAEDILVVEVDNAVARGNLPCTPVARPPVEGTTWRNAPIRAGVCAVASLLAGEDITALEVIATEVEVGPVADRKSVV